MFLGTCLNGTNYEVYEFDEADPEDMGKLVLTLRDADSMDVRTYHSKTFDTVEDLMEFIYENRRSEKRRYDFYFQLHAYKIIREHYIQLYYSWHVSSS